MSLFDLVLFGVGCTVGSGVFVLAGVVAHSYAGPSSSISYLLAGFVAALTALPYAELSAAFPMDGSTYSYSYITLGEVFAIMSSLCQTLEYGGSAAAVARSWGEKFVDWVREGHEDGNDIPQWLNSFLDPGYGINPMGGIIAVVCTLVLLCGIQESKMATNVVSSTKILLILFMIVGGFVLASGVVPENDENNPRPASFLNWNPFVPPEFGPVGIVQGSSILFFAFLGYDCICNLSGEAKNPVKDVPRAVLLTLLVDGLVYMMAALSLTAMLPYKQISTISGFPRAFGANGWIWAEKLSGFGEIVTLPLVVLASVQSQTRLLFAMSKDKLVHSLFGKVSFSKSCCSRKEDKIGNISSNIRICGIVVVLLALLVPFQYMDDLISSGALFLFSLTDCCLLTLRYKTRSESFLGNTSDIDDTVSILSIVAVKEHLSLGRSLVLLNVFSLLSGLCFAYIPISTVKCSLAITFAVLVLLITLYIEFFCDQAESNRFALEGDGYGIGKPRFRTPLVPYLPSLGIFLNWFMVANIGWIGIAMLAAYLLGGILLYGAICSGKSECTEANISATLNYQGHEILPESANEDLREALLLKVDDHDEQIEENDSIENNLAKDLSEIETSKSSLI